LGLGLSGIQPGRSVEASRGRARQVDERLLECVRALREGYALRVGLLPFGLKRLRGRTATIVILIALALTTALVASTASKRGCSSAGELCNVAGGFATSVAVFVFGFVLVAIVAAQVVHRYLGKLARHHRTAPQSDHLVHAIVRDIVAASTTGDVAPRIIVGPSGAGRSTLLSQLARDLVAHSWVPVLVQLRAGADFPGFRELARATFLDHVDMDLASREEGERIWRRVSGSGRLAVLVDDLQSIDPAEGAHVRAAFEQVRDEGYVLVTTSRPIGVTRGLTRWVTSMDSLEPAEALRRILECGQIAHPARAVPPARHGHLESLIECGALNESRFYIAALEKLAAIGALSRLDAIRTNLGVDEVRRHVLDSFVAAYLDGTLAPDDHSTLAERSRALSGMQLVAYDALLAGERAIVDVSMPGIGAALEAGLLSRSQDDAVRVRHALLQNYLASGAIGDGPSWRTLLARRLESSDVLETLRFWSAGIDRRDRAVEAYDVLLERSLHLRDARALRLVATAARISKAAALPDAAAPTRRSDGALADAFADVWEFGDLLDRRAALKLVAGLRDRARFAVLRECANDPDYAVRWAATRGLCELQTLPRASGTEDLDIETLQALVEPAFMAATQVAAAIRAGRENADDVDDWDERLRPLIGLGWVLPVLGIGAPDAAMRAGVWKQFARMLRLFDGRAWVDDTMRPPDPVGSFRGITRQRGPEATVAQGLKAAATLAGSIEPADATNMCALAKWLVIFYETTEFWYSRIVLLQGLSEIALTLRLLAAAPRDATERDALEATAGEAEQVITTACAPLKQTVAGGRHPFTVATARLCEEGLRTARQTTDPEAARTILRQHVWVDEAEAVGSGGVGLGSPAVRLLGAITVLLNLNERGDHQQRVGFPTRADLPACLADGEDRHRLLDRPGEGPCGCAFGLCTRHPPLARGAVRELSKAFCRSARAAADAPVPGWVTHVRAGDIRRFWREIEHQAER